MPLEFRDTILPKGRTRPAANPALCPLNLSFDVTSTQNVTFRCFLDSCPGTTRVIRISTWQSVLNGLWYDEYNLAKPKADEIRTYIVPEVEEVEHEQQVATTPAAEIWSRIISQLSLGTMNREFFGEYIQTLVPMDISGDRSTVMVSDDHHKRMVEERAGSTIKRAARGIGNIQVVYEVAT